MVIVLSGHGVPATVEAQDATPESKAEPATDSKAAVPSPTVTVANAGASRHVAGRWSTLSVNGLNKTTQDAEEMSVVTIGDGSELQYGRRLWIPAGSKRQSWLAVQIPEEVSS